MRLCELDVMGFRGFPERQIFDLSSDVVILFGPNGTGKTSFMDAILWCLSGDIDRFSTKDIPISKYSRDGMARVSVTIQEMSGGDPIEITRKVDRTGAEELRIVEREVIFAKDDAVARLSRLLFDSQNVNQEFATVSHLFTRSVYLQQDLMREFIEADNPSNRFELLSEMAGVGTILELKSTLESGRTEWRKNIKRIQSDKLDPVLARYEYVSARASTLSSSAIKTPNNDIEERAFRLKAAQILPSLDAKFSLEDMLTSLSRSRNADTRSVDYLIEISGIKRSIEEIDLDIPERLSSLDAQIKAKTEELSKLELQIGKTTKELGELYLGRSQGERLSLMADIASDHLTGRCPVCNQEHDLHASTKNLEKYSLYEQDLTSKTISLEEELGGLRGAMESLRAELSNSMNQKNQLESIATDLDRRTDSLRSKLSEAGLGPDISLEELDDRIEQYHLRINRLAGLIEMGEKVNLALVRESEKSQLSALEAEQKRYRKEIDTLQKEIVALQKTDSTVTQFIEGLRSASLEIARSKIEDIAPLFQRIYSRIDPHPTFKVTELVAKNKGGKGKVEVFINDPNLDENLEAGPILSSSQLNAFAVSLFLALNLSIPNFKLNITMLDDPLQNLDKLNLLGLVDVLRRIKPHKQIFISTHDERFKGLLERKLRPTNEAEKLLTVFFEDWSTDGPKTRCVRKPFHSENRVLPSESITPGSINA
ncbi:MAG: AAA family ATPase [Maricaulaceae bacterium]